MAVNAYFQRHPRLRKLIKTLVGGFIAYTVLGFLVVPPIVRSIAQSKLTEALHRQTTIDSLRFNPLALTVKIRGFTIKERNSTKTFISFEQLYVNAQLMSLFKGAVVLREVTLDKPYINLERRDTQTFNFSDLLEGPPSKETSKEAAKPEQGEQDGAEEPPRYSVSNIRIRGGRLDVWDAEKKARHQIRRFELGLPFLSNLPLHVEIFVQPRLSATINGHALSLLGSSKPFKGSRDTNVELNIKDVDLPRYLAYVPVKLGFKLLSGRFDAKTKVAFVQHAARAPSVTVSGQLSLTKIKAVYPSGKPLLDLPALRVAIAPSNVTAPEVHLESVRLEKPELWLGLDRRGVLSVASLVDTGPPAKDEPQDSTLRLRTDRFEVQRGRVHFADRSRPRPFKTSITRLDVKVLGLSLDKGARATASVRLATAAGETAELTSRFSLKPLAASGDVKLKQLKLPRYGPYLPANLKLKLRDGALDAATHYVFASGLPAPRVELSDASLALTALKLTTPAASKDFLAVPAFAVSNTSVDLAKMTVDVGRVTTKGGRLRIRRLRDGSLDLQSLLGPPATPAAVETAAATPAAPPAASGKGWAISVRNLALSDYAVRAEDRVPRRPVRVTLDQIAFNLGGFSTAPRTKTKIGLGLRVNRRGRLKVRGDLTLSPMRADVRVDVRKLGLRLAEPYFTDNVRFLISGGDLSSSGRVVVSVPERGDPRLTYRGGVTIARLAAVEKKTAEELLKWDALSVTGINVGLGPTRVEVADITLGGLSSNLVTGADGRLNLERLLVADPTKVRAEKPGQKGKSADQPKSARETRPLPLKVGRVNITNGRVSFTDRKIKPHYAATIEGLKGTLTGLTSNPESRAAFDIGAKVDGAPLKVTGTVNPLGKKLALDVKVGLKDVDLSGFTPYSGKFAGYAIDRGKLSLELAYRISGGKLAAKNQVHINQFTFGDSIASRDATKLPVRLAVALLKDRHGVISLDVPVAGSLDDPKFSVVRIVFKVLLNLLVKAAMSPFALLGSLVGGGEELSHCDFKTGVATLDNKARAKLKKLAKALSERPGVNLEIAGRADRWGDRAAMRKERFLRKLKVQKFKGLLDSDQRGTSLEKIRINGAKEYERYLKAAYKAEPFKKPKNFIGMERGLPAKEMERQIYAHIRVSDEDLRLLARRRAQAVKSLIVGSRKVKAKRLFVLEPRVVSSAKQRSRRGTIRVELTIK